MVCEFINICTMEECLAVYKYQCYKYNEILKVFNDLIEQKIKENIKENCLK